jgi:hypothetical protein
MNNALLMQILNGRDNLSKFSARLFLLHATVHDQVVEYFAAGRVLHDQVQRLVGLNHLEQLHYVGMVEHLHDANLTVKNNLKIFKLWYEI